MANTFKFGNGNWAVKDGYALAYNDENGNFKPLPFDFTRASSATRVNKQGLIETVGSNEPRIDFSNDAKGALKLEPTKSNISLYSEDYTQGSWLKTSVTVESNSVIAPDGSLTADKLDFSASESARMAQINSPAAGTYTFSVYLRSVSGTGTFNIRLQSTGDTPASNIVTLNEEWQRFEVTINYTAANPLVSYIGYYITDSYLQEVYAWGAQLEVGYATSIINTSGSAVTRVADVCNNGGNNQVINSTEGVLYYEVSAQDNSITTSVLSISSGSNANTLYSGFSSTSNTIQAQLVVGGVAQTNMNYVVSDRTEFNKVAILYQNNNHKMYVNGVEAIVDTIGSVPSANTFDRLNFDLGQGSFDFYGNVKDVRLYNTALTDAELQALTTL